MLDKVVKVCYTVGGRVVSYLRLLWVGAAVCRLLFSLDAPEVQRE